jgi:hypothetical protein
LKSRYWTKKSLWYTEQELEDQHFPEENKGSRNRKSASRRYLLLSNVDNFNWSKA